MTVVICCYLERENSKVFKLHLNDYSNFEIGAYLKQTAFSIFSKQLLFIPTRLNILKFETSGCAWKWRLLKCLKNKQADVAGE